MHLDDITTLSVLVKAASGGRSTLDVEAARRMMMPMANGLGEVRDDKRADLAALLASQVSQGKEESRMKIGFALKGRKRLKKIEAMLAQILENQLKEEHLMQTVQEILTQLTADAAAERTVINSAITYIKGVPDAIRAAVREAQAANPELSDGDLAAFAKLSQDFEDQTASLTDTLTANTGDSSGSGTGPTTVVVPPSVDPTVAPSVAPGVIPGAIETPAPSAAPADPTASE